MWSVGVVGVGVGVDGVGVVGYIAFRQNSYQLVGCY